MRITLTLIILACLFCCQSTNSSETTILTDDISIVFPDSVESQEIDDYNKMYMVINDSFQIFVAVSFLEENVTRDSITKINGHDANAYRFCEAAQGKHLKTAWSKKKSADRIHFSFQSLNDAENNVPQRLIHSGLIIYHKMTMVTIDFITRQENETKTKNIKENLFRSIEIK